MEPTEGRLDGGADTSGSPVPEGFGHTLGWGSWPAVLLVDLVRAYLEPASPLFADADDAVDAAARVAAAARAAAVPVLFTRVEYQPGGADGGVFYRKLPALSVFDRGSALGDFPDRLRPLDGEPVIVKQYPSAFFKTSLHERLQALGVDTVVVCGLSTSGCVRATVVDAVSLGYIPIVVREAVGDRAERPHEQALYDLSAKYADVLSERDVIDHFARSQPL